MHEVTKDLIAEVRARPEDFRLLRRVPDLQAGHSFGGDQPPANQAGDVVFLDCETTGLDRIQSRIIQLGMLRIRCNRATGELIEVVSRTGGHLGAGLGVVELTVALHHLFDTPRDRLIWDVGHQAYPHKILTGRRAQMGTLRQGGGLSGFTRRVESPYDPFGAAHASTSISAGLGMAVARDLAGGSNNIICVIGDGAMSAGMAYEAMNNAGTLESRLIVVLNDNDMSIAPPVGAMSAYLSRLISSHSYRNLRHVAAQVARKFPRPMAQMLKRAEEYARGLVTGGRAL